MPERSQRAYIRHPSDIPIEIARATRDRKDRQQLHNISFGGLCCGCSAYAQPGTLIWLNIAVVEPPFEAKAKVVWCRSCASGYELGVEFMDAEDAFRVRMVEQICHIEQYKRWVRDTQGRELSAEQAAHEWIDKHAADFPNPAPRDPLKR